MPFTSLRFARPRLPTAGQALGLAIAVVALGLGAWALDLSDQAAQSLTQTRTLLAVSTRGLIAGRLTADQLAASARADTDQMMAAQDLARRQAERAASMPGYPPPVYARGSEDGEGAGSGAASPAFAGAPYGQASYAPVAGGASPYGTSSYSYPQYGAAQPGTASSATEGNAMGYTLPQATSH